MTEHFSSIGQSNFQIQIIPALLVNNGHAYSASMRLSTILRNESPLTLAKETAIVAMRPAVRQRRLWQDLRYLLYIHRHMGQLERSLKRIGPQNKHLDELSDVLEALSIAPKDSIVKNDLMESGQDIWNKMMHRSRSVIEKTKQYNTRDMTLLETKVPMLRKYLAHTEILTNALLLFAKEGLAYVPNWEPFDRFWAPVAWTPLALILAPELIDLMFKHHGPKAAYNLLIQLGDDKFFPGNHSSITDKKSVYFITHRYEMAVTGAVNAFIYNITRGKHLDPVTNSCIHYNILYDVFDKLNRNISLITLLPKAISLITATLPRKAYADFYAIFLVRNVNLRNSQFRSFLDRMLLDGTEAEKALVMNADRLIEVSTGKKHNSPVLALNTYKTILAHLGRFPTSYNRTLASFIIDNLLVNFYNKNKVAVLDMALRYSADTGAMEDAARIYQFILHAKIQPTMDVYMNMFRGFRIFAQTWGPQRGFDILKLIHDQNITFPPYFCTEILRFVERQYHGLIVYNFYLAYFENTHLEELGLVSYFQGLHSEDIEIPVYEPSITPDKKVQMRYAVNPIALSILYAAALNSMTNAHHVAELYNRFKTFLLAQVPEAKRTQYYFVFDGFVQTLCFKFGTPEAISMAHGIVETLPQIIPRVDLSYSSPSVAGTAAKAEGADAASELPGAGHRLYRYTGRPLRAFEYLLSYHARQGQLDHAVDILNAAIAYTPRAAHFALVKPIIKALVRAGDFELAERWFDYCKTALGVVFQPDDQTDNDFVHAIEAYRAGKEVQPVAETN